MILIKNKWNTIFHKIESLNLNRAHFYIPKVKHCG